VTTPALVSGIYSACAIADPGEQPAEVLLWKSLDPRRPPSHRAIVLPALLVDDSRGVSASLSASKR